MPFYDWILSLEEYTGITNSVFLLYRFNDSIFSPILGQLVFASLHAIIF
jgi:hypothetical protein